MAVAVRHDAAPRRSLRDHERAPRLDPRLILYDRLQAATIGPLPASPKSAMVDLGEVRLTAAVLKRRFAELRDLVNEWDPIGLIDTGASREEYDCLVGPLSDVSTHRTRFTRSPFPRS